MSVETVRLCTGDVRSKEDRPIFSVPVARATAHRGGDGVEFPAAVYGGIRKRCRGLEKQRAGFGKNENKKREMGVHVRGMKRFSSGSSHMSSSQLLSPYSDGAFICSGVCLAAKRDAHVSAG